MSLPKSPSGAEVAQHIFENPARLGETQDEHIRRLIKDVVLANTQAQVALAIGSSGEKVRKAYNGERTQLATVCRIAKACNCELILRPLPTD